VRFFGAFENKFGPGITHRVATNTNNDGTFEKKRRKKFDLF